MRLIDADALPYSRVRIYYGENNTGKPIVGGCNAVVMSVAIKDAPTIDAVPVVHARWVPRGSADYDDGMFYCSSCKDERYFGDEVSTSEEAEKYAHFCPNCGAKMDTKEAES